MDNKVIVDNWLCLYIYINPPYEFFLRECLYPIINELLNEKVIAGYFFIRYWEEGAHIRFRTLFKENNCFDIYEEKVVQEILFFIHQNNLSCSSNDGTYVLSTTYEPEIDRYGGKHGIKVAEKIFRNSSEIIFLLIKKDLKWNYNTALKQAIFMNFIMMYTFFPNAKVLINFFSVNYNKWFFATKTIPRYSQHCIDFFASIKEEIVSEFKKIFSQLKHGMRINEPYADWILKIKEINKELVGLVNEKKIEYKKGLSDQVYLQNIFESYVHMNNNRLGINNSHESLIAFSIIQSLNEISRKK